jgi:hypothetical protein
VLSILEQALRHKQRPPGQQHKQAAQQQRAPAPKPAAAPGPVNPAALIKPSGRFERETTQADLKAVGLQADIDLYYKGSAAPAAAQQPGQQAGAAPAKAAAAAAQKQAAAGKPGADAGAAAKLPIIIVPKGARAGRCGCMLG